MIMLMSVPNKILLSFVCVCCRGGGSSSELGGGARFCHVFILPTYARARYAICNKGVGQLLLLSASAYIVLARLETHRVHVAAATEIFRCHSSYILGGGGRGRAPPY